MHILRYKGKYLMFVCLNFKMACSTQEISENVKQARENALIGNYDDSNVFYKGALQGVQQMFKNTPDLDMKQKWKEVSSKLAVFIAAFVAS